MYMCIYVVVIKHCTKCSETLDIKCLLKIHQYSSPGTPK